MSRYVLSERAEQDLFEIAVYIGRRNEAAALQLVDRVHRKSQRLAEYPLLGTQRSDLLPGSRSEPVGNYLIFYYPAEFGIQVIRIVHGARDLEALFGEPRD
jgi:toxin ParE1/3/4